MRGGKRSQPPAVPCHEPGELWQHLGPVHVLHLVELPGLVEGRLRGEREDPALVPCLLQTGVGEPQHTAAE